MRKTIQNCMEIEMPHLWTLAGILVIAISVFHCYLGVTKVVPTIKVAPTSFKRLFAAFFVISGAYWALGGVALLAFANGEPTPLRTAIALFTCFMYASGAAANAWAKRGRHFGWAALLVVTALVATGY